MSRSMITELPDNPSIEDFRRYDGTLYVKNNSVHAITCNDKDHRFLLQPSGHDGDCQVLPEHALKQANFQKMVLRGQITISPDLAAYALEGMNRIDAEREKQLEDIKSLTEENSSSKDLVEKNCLVCKDLVFQPQGDIDALVPPLCPMHKSRESNYIGTPVQNEDGTTGASFALLPNRS